MSVHERFVESVRKIAQDEARRVSPPVERWRVVKLKPLTLESFTSEARATDGDDDFDIVRRVRAKAAIGDTVIVMTNEHGDRVAMSLVLPHGAADDE